MSLRLALIALILALGACSSEPEAPPAPPPEQPAEGEKTAAEGEEKEPEAAVEEKKAPIAATIGAIDGKATVNRKPAKPGQALSAGDVVATKRRGHVDIHMNDGSRVRLGPGSRLEIGKISDEEGVSVSLALGKLYSWITPGTPYEVVTSNAVAGVRGTKFFVEEKKRKSYFCVCEGTIAVKGDQNEAEIELKEGFDLYARRKKAGDPKESAAQMIDDLNGVFDELAAAGESALQEGAKEDAPDGGEADGAEDGEE